MKCALTCLLAVVAVAGCARPEEVRDVARSALPVAVQLESSALKLERRLALQRRGFAERNADIGRRATLELEEVAYLEREWKLRNEADRLRRLTLLRERDAAILAAPLAVLTGVTVQPVGQNPISTEDLTSAIAALTRLTGEDRMDAEELLGFAQRVNDELEKIETEASKTATGTEEKKQPH